MAPLVARLRSLRMMIRSATAGGGSFFLAKLLLTASAVAAPLLALHLYTLYRQKSLDEATAVSALRTRAESRRARSTPCSRGWRTSCGFSPLAARCSRWMPSAADR